MTKQAADIEIPTDTCTHDRIKMLIYCIISFVSGFFFLWTFWQLGQFRSFRYARFVLMFFYANVSVLMVTMKYHFMIGCRAHDHNLAGVVLIT